MAARPARRATGRRQNIIDSDSDDSAEAPTRSSPPDQADLAPAPRIPLRRPARMNTKASQSNPALDIPTDRTDSFGIDNVSDAPIPGAATPSSTKMPPRARRNVRDSRRSLLADTGEPPQHQLPTPHASKSPEPALDSLPLGDITEHINNSPAAIHQDFKQQTVGQTEGAAAALEKPMDIVVRTRAKALPALPEQAGPKPRMVITHLVLTNFKSYAGRQEVGPFHASFSSVVGPNGSGKSNVIDSLLFVFGFRASKMRQGKISSLIHNSAAYPDLDFCEVQVHFHQVLDDPSGSKEVMPDSNLVVSRKAFKNNSSSYYINGSTSNFTTVTTLLRDHGIDLDHKRFLILQGEVESIAQMKPKAASEHDDGLLEYLEDIIGTSKYKTPIEESAAETDTLNEICREKNTRVQHVEKEKTSLEDKKNAALAYIKDENDLALKQSALWQIFVNECDDNTQVTEEAIGQLQSQLDAEIARHHGGELEIEKIAKRHTAELKELERMQQSTHAILKVLSKADKESVKFEEKRKHLNSKLKKLEKSISTSRSSISESTAYLQRLCEDLERNHTNITDLESRLGEEERSLAAVRDSLKGKTEGFSNQIGAKQKLLEPWLEHINEKKSMIAVAQSELDMLRDRELEGAQAISDIQSRLEALREDRSNKKKAFGELQAEKTHLTDETAKLRSINGGTVGREAELRSRASVARQKTDEAKANLSHSNTQGNVLSGLLRLRDSGRISGFHGRLGNLGTIDSKYDVAISTACPALDNLVVDSVEIGQQCIDFLRKTNLGRANFILLDRLGQRDLSNIQTPEAVPRLFDLIKPKDENFLPAFYSVLQNTLVAQDLDQANRVAYGAKRWRVVTLDGQLIDKSGTMSGGGTRVAKGAMSSKLAADTTKEQVTKLETDQEKEETRLSELLSEQQALQEALQMAQHRLPKLETELQKMQLEIDTAERNIVDTEKRAGELQGQSQPISSDKSRKKELLQTIQDLEVEISDLSPNTVGLENDIKALQEKIMEVGGVRLRGQKAKVDGLKEEIATLTEEMSTAELNKAKTEKAVVKHEKAVAEATKDVSTVEADLQRVEEEAKTQSANISGTKRDAEEAQEALETKKEELAQLKAELDRQRTELNDARGAEIEMRNQLEEHQKVLNENTKRLKYWQEKLRKLTVQNVSDADAAVEEQSVGSLTRDELSDMDKNMLKAEIAVLEEKTQNANVELGVLGEYRRRVEEHAARSLDLTEAVAQRDTAKKRCEELRRLRLEGFMEGFSTISLRLKEMYQMITMGGNAELELVDSLDPFSEGILFSVMPPKKSWKNISNLSGGEKTLSSLALVFALHHYKPTPLYVMDEIDAALDFRNVSIVASYIKERTKNAQFIVISLRNNMFELASRLVGVYKVNHMTKSVTVENRDYIMRSGRQQHQPAPQPHGQTAEQVAL